MVNMPVHAAGIRKEPPYTCMSILRLIWCLVSQLTMSVPIPKGLPPKAIRADSPPDEPPDVTFRLSGLTVRPKVLFTDSAYIASAPSKV